jgi:SNF2 family DNA or RNA helicase
MTDLKLLWSGFTYFPHQLDGIRWMLEKETVGTSVSEDVVIRGGFQCDDMGLGKTIQVTSVIINHRQPLTLLFAPLAMVDTWIGVLQRAGCNVYQVEDKQWKLSPLMQKPTSMKIGVKRPAVYVTNYEKMYHQPTLFSTHTWNRIVLDEAHKIRNGKSRISEAACAIPAMYRWVVTGTPLVNSLKDIVALLGFLGVPCDKQFRWKPRYLDILSQMLLHRSLDSLRGVIQGAPPVPNIQQMILPFATKEEEDFYHGVQGAIASVKYAKDVLTAAQIFKLLLRLRQISVHPQIYIEAKRRELIGYDREDWVGDSTKLQAIQTIISGEVDSTHHYLIFCQFHEEMSLIRQSLLDAKLVDDDHILLYHGGMNQRERTEVLERSKASTERTVLLLQLQAGGVGLNLQEYDRIIFVSPWWTSALMDQAIARAVRMGQQKVVEVYHLKLEAENKISLDIDALVSSKAEQKRSMLERLFTLCAQPLHEVDTSHIL